MGSEAKTLDIDQLLAETPGVRHRAHLDNAGAALMPRPVLDAMTDHLRREAEIGGYEAAAEAAARLDGVYDSIALLIGARRDEIAVTENATVAWQMAFYALAVGFRRDDRILTSRAEYAANYVAYLQLARRQGVVIDVIADDAEGVLDPEALRAMLDERVRLIAITWENSYAARLGLKVAADWRLAWRRSRSAAGHWETRCARVCGGSLGSRSTTSAHGPAPLSASPSQEPIPKPSRLAARPWA